MRNLLNNRESDWMYNQSGVIPFRILNGKIQVLLITSRRRKKWIFPKGIIEPGMTPQESAASEAIEEAGVIGKVFVEMLGEYEYNKWGGICHVQMFPMEVTKIMDNWMESSFRERKWVSIAEAKRLLNKDKLKLMLDKLIEYN